MKQVLLFGAVGGILITLLQYSEYRFLVLQHSFEIYAALIAATFATLGIWLGFKLTSQPQKVLAPPPPPPIPPDPKPTKLSITPREHEILQLIAQGLSNREIAEKLFVSENTVKTHASHVFDKLGARRRTQAVQLGKQLGLLP